LRRSRFSGRNSRRRRIPILRAKVTAALGIDDVVGESPALQKAMYAYDFGDDWEHVVVHEGMKPADESLTYPRCVTETLSRRHRDSDR
jgi:hypothetical protein